MNDFKDIKVNTETLEILQKVHNIVIKSNKKILFKIFPIYIKYFIGEKVIAIIYYKSKFVTDGKINLGINTKNKPGIKGCKNASYMKYPNINFSYLISNSNYSENNILNLIKLA